MIYKVEHYWCGDVPTTYFGWFDKEPTVDEAVKEFGINFEPHGDTPFTIKGYGHVSEVIEIEKLELHYERNIIDVTDIDWAELREMKDSLLVAIIKASDGNQELLDRLMDFINTIQTKAAVSIGQGAVFGVSEEKNDNL
jgi:DNA-binding protein Fis